MKTSLSIALTVLGMTTLPSFGAEATLDRLSRCSAETDERRRLACFDREIAPVKPQTAPAPAAPAARPSPQVPSPVAPAVAPSNAAGSSLGEEQLKGKARPPADQEAELNARVAELRQADGSSMLLTLDNGQAWRLQNLELASYLRKGDAITIRKGALGSYRLTRDDGNDKDWIRAQRIR